MVERNKLGQRMMDRGAETRRQLLAAARRLLIEMSPLDLTVHAISRNAGTSPATFYVYFKDVKDLLLTLCNDISCDSDSIALLLTEKWDAKNISKSLEIFAQAYYNHWETHRRLLIARNIFSDLGDERFFDARMSFAMPIMDALSNLIYEAGRAAQTEFTKIDAWSQTVIVFAALEQLFVYKIRAYIPERPTSVASVLRAEIDILTKILTPAPIAGKPKRLRT